MALLNLENIAVLAISKEVAQGIGYGSPQGIIRLVFAQIISKITGSEVTPFAVITELMHKIGIHNTIREYGVSEEAFLGRLDEMVEQAFDDQCTGTNPRYPLMKEIKEMYLNAYYGG